MRAFFSLILTLSLGGCAALARPAGAPTAAPATLVAALDSILADTALAHAHWGVLVQDPASGQALFERNARRVFVPASNMKLITGAAVLEALGPDFRYRTTFSATGRIQAGVLRGDLVVRGSGDPTLSARFGGDPRGAMRAWADSLRARGVSRITGGIIGVDSAFVGPPLGSGWSWDDLDAYYATEYGALQLNEGAIDVQVIPSRTVGFPVIVVLDPPTQYVRVNNQAVTAPAGTPARLSLTRDPVGPGITVTGSVPVDTPFVREPIAVRGQTAFFLAVLRETLREAGVAVEGQALDADEWPESRATGGETPLFTHASPPLREILPAMMKPSQNWIAETLLLTLGREARGEGSARAGIAVVDSLFRAWSLPVQELRMADGSGLSRYNLVSPSLLAALLSHMSRSANREVWLASMPVAGVDGTLANRMREAPLYGRVAAKTGSLSGVRSLSGYLEVPGREPLIFSFVVNNHMRTARTVDAVVEAALSRITTTLAR